MSCPGGSNCTCGCCAGTSVQTPQVRLNRAGLPAISYRVGSWATFKESMLARLSSSDYPALNALKTRDDNDYTIAFFDATSVMNNAMPRLNGTASTTAIVAVTTVPKMYCSAPK